MSFSLDVKDELLKSHPAEEHCRLAELSALVRFMAGRGNVSEDEIIISSDNKSALRKCFTMLGKTFNIETDVFEDESHNLRTQVSLNAAN